MKIIMEPIGIVHHENESVPRHWTISEVRGILKIDRKYLAGLRDIHPGDLIVVLFCFHQSPAFTERLLIQNPPHCNEAKGVFSTCSPRRPNPIGMSVLKVLNIQENIIDVAGLDMVDGTPILDIKPYVIPPDGWDQNLSNVSI
jgi:tRNA (adenine37-N6)-methyltransferase